VPVDETARLAKAEDRIHSVEADLAKAKLEWVKLVRGLGISAVARELGETPQAVSDRVKAAERTSQRSESGSMEAVRHPGRPVAT
jgi:hypothetical protein